MPWAAETPPQKKIPPRPYKTKKFERSRFNLTAHTTHTTHITHITKIVHFVVPWAAEKNSPPKNTASSLQKQKFKRPRFKLNGATNYIHTNTRQHTPHTLYFYPSSDTPRSSVLRWNFGASAVRSCPCGLPCLRAAATASFRSAAAYFLSLVLLSQLISAACCGCLL